MAGMGILRFFKSRDERGRLFKIVGATHEGSDYPVRLELFKFEQRATGRGSGQGGDSVPPIWVSRASIPEDE